MYTSVCILAQAPAVNMKLALPCIGNCSFVPYGLNLSLVSMSSQTFLRLFQSFQFRIVLFTPVSVRNLMRSPPIPIGLVSLTVTSVLSTPDTDLTVTSLILPVTTLESSDSSVSSTLDTFSDFPFFFLHH